MWCLNFKFTCRRFSLVTIDVFGNPSLLNNIQRALLRLQLLRYNDSLICTEYNQTEFVVVFTIPVGTRPPECCIPRRAFFVPSWPIPAEATLAHPPSLVSWVLPLASSVGHPVKHKGPCNNHNFTNLGYSASSLPLKFQIPHFY